MAIRRERGRDLFLVVFGTLILVLFVFPLTDVFALGSEVTTSSTVTGKKIFRRGTVVSGSPAAIVHIPKKFEVFFEIEGRVCHFRVSEKEFIDFKNGQSISVTYRSGMITGTFLTLLLPCN